MFAISTRLPARAAASVDGKPAEPTMAAMTVSTSSLAAISASASMPQRTRVGAPTDRNASDNFSADSASRITATAGRCARHCSSNRW